MDEAMLSIGSIICAVEDSVLECSECGLITPRKHGFVCKVNGVPYIVSSFPWGSFNKGMCVICYYGIDPSPAARLWLSCESSCGAVFVSIVKKFRESIYGQV